MKVKPILVTVDGKRVNSITRFKLERNCDGTYTAIPDDETEKVTHHVISDDETEKELSNEQN